MTDLHRFWLAGSPATGEESFDVRRPYDGTSLGSVSVPTSAQVERAVAAADEVRAEAAALPAHVRAAASRTGKR